MNFIAGFLFLVFGQREDLAFSVLREVIQRRQMHDLFDTQLPLLKLNFYQMDRLIAILLPDLHTHFKEEAINSSYFSAPYFITLFTSTLQLQLNMEHAAGLLRLWDHFIVTGWKAIFKVSLAILGEFEEQLLAMSFEVLLTQIVNLPQKYLIREGVSESQAVTEFDQKFKEVKLPTMLLERFKKEFDDNFETSKRTSSAGNQSFEENPQNPVSKQSSFRAFFSRKDRSNSDNTQ